MFPNTKLWTMLAAGLVLFSCQKEQADPDSLVTTGDKQLTFTATIDGSQTRTSVDGTKIVWNAAEEINIFYGASAGSRFVSQNTEPSQSVTFSGTLTAFTGTTGDGEPNSFWAIYPYNASNSSDGTGVSAYLPEHQVGVAGNIPDKTMLMVAKTHGLALSFKQVCAMLKVIVDTPDIERIEIRGNNGETVAGRVRVQMNSEGLPEWQDAGTGGEKIIELKPSSGAAFSIGEYYIDLLPQEFTAGFTMTCYKSDVNGSYSTDAVTFVRNEVRTVRTSKVTKWAQPNNVIYYKSSNGAVVTPENPDAFNVNILSNEYVDGQGIITFDGDVTIVGESAFEESDLTEIYLPNSVTSIGKWAFSDSHSLMTVTLPENLSSIGQMAFGYCYRMTSITLPDGLTSIGWGAFQNCSKLTSISIPESVTSIDDVAFSHCDALTSFSGKYATSDGLYLVAEGRLIAVASGAIDGNPAIPENVTSIGANVFYYNSKLTNITIPEGVTIIGAQAFAYCRNLVDITVLSGIPPTEGTGMFTQTNDCPIYVPFASLDAYKSSWSAYADRIRPIPEPIAFVDPKVKALCVANWDTDGDGELSTTEAEAVTSIGTVFRYNESITSFDELQYFTGLTTIPDNAFWGCYKMTSITIPESVMVIGASAFMYCEGLTSLVIPNSVTRIDGDAFSECHGLTVVTLPGSITSIAQDLFYNCYGLTSVTIPESVTSIGAYAFQFCSALTSINIPGQVASIGEWAFKGSGLTSVTIPASVTSMGTGVFIYCSNLASITVASGNPVYYSKDNCNAILLRSNDYLQDGCKNTVIPNTVKTIGKFAFCGHTGMTSISIPASVTTINSSAFYDCSGLTSITVNNQTPPTIEWQVFDNTNNCPIYVPMGSESQYKSKWTAYASRIQSIM